MNYEKFFTHPVVLKMCFNNLDFYDKVHSTDYDYNRFACHRWNSMAIIKFLAFGVRIGLNDAEFWNKKRQAIIQTLYDNCPRWKARFHWATLLYKLEK